MCFRKPVHQRRRPDRLSLVQTLPEPPGQSFYTSTVSSFVERYYECIQGIPKDDSRWLSTFSLSAFQFDRRAAAKSDRKGILVDSDTDYLAKQANWSSQAENQGNGQPVFLYCRLCVAGKVFQPRRLSKGHDPGFCSCRLQSRVQDYIARVISDSLGLNFDQSCCRTTNLPGSPVQTR